MDLRDDRRAFADGGTHSLRGTRAQVTDREDAGTARAQRHPRILAGAHEPVGIDIHAAIRKPLGGRVGAEKEENVADGVRLLRARLAIAPRDRLDAEFLGAVQARDPPVPRAKLDVLSGVTIRSMRYFDMLAASPAPRTSIQTLEALPDRNTAAWPAELPPPTSTISLSAQRFASMGEAQYQTPLPSRAARILVIGTAVASARKPLRSPSR